MDPKTNARLTALEQSTRILANGLACEGRVSELLNDARPHNDPQPDPDAPTAPEPAPESTPTPDDPAA